MVLAEVPRLWGGTHIHLHQGLTSASEFTVAFGKVVLSVAVCPPSMKHARFSRPPKCRTWMSQLHFYTNEHQMTCETFFQQPDAACWGFRHIQTKRDASQDIVPSWILQPSSPLPTVLNLGNGVEQKTNLQSCWRHADMDRLPPSV